MIISFLHYMTNEILYMELTYYFVTWEMFLKWVLKAECGHGICSPGLLGMPNWKNRLSSGVQGHTWQGRLY